LYIFVRLSDLSIPATFIHRIETLETSKVMLRIFTLYNLCVVGLGIATHFRGFFWEPFKYLLTSKGFFCLIVYLRVQIEKTKASVERKPLHDLLQCSVITNISYGIRKTTQKVISPGEDCLRGEFEVQPIPLSKDQIKRVWSGSQSEFQTVLEETGKKIQTTEPTECIENDSLSTIPSVNRGSVRISRIADLLTIPFMVNVQTRVEFLEYFPSIFRDIRKQFGVENDYKR
jgi:hypothetical protein